MFTKIYLALLGIAVAVMAILAFFCYSQLQSVGFSPSQIVENYLSYDSIYKTFLWISSLVLLISANAVLWTTKKSWALWASFLFFAFFILLNMWWLESLLFDYKKLNALTDNSFQFSGILAAVMVVVVGVGIFFNQFILLRLRERMYPTAVSEDDVVSPQPQIEQ